MAAFSSYHQNLINIVIRSLQQRVANYSYLDMTHDEFLSLFVPPEEHEIFREIAPKIHHTVAGQTMRPMSTSLGISVWMSATGETMPSPIPRNPTIQPSAPEELRERFTSWVSTADHSLEFGRVRAVFEQLNNSMSKSAIRYYWPTILALLNEHPDLAPLARDLEEMTSSKRTFLKSDLIVACRKTAAAVTSARLLPVEPPPYQNYQVRMAIQGSRHVSEPGLGQFYCS